MTINYDILIRVAPIVIAIISLVFAFISEARRRRERKESEETRQEEREESEEARQKEREEKNKPKPQLLGLDIPLSTFKVQAGEHVNWVEGHSIQKELEPYILGEARKMKDTVWSYKGKRHLFINLCNKHIKNTKRAVLAFDILTIKIGFSDSSIKLLRIKDVYTLRGDKIIGEGLECDKVEFPVRGSSVEIPVIYTYEDGTDTSICVQNLYEDKMKFEKGGGTAEDISLLKERSNVDRYMNCTETAYLLECETHEGKLYKYSFYVEIDENGESMFPLEGIDESEFYKRYSEKLVKIIQERDKKYNC